MGEIAEMMLDGTCCQDCGEFLGEEGPGYPQRCAGCARLAVLKPKKAVTGRPRAGQITQGKAEKATRNTGKKGRYK